MKFTDTLVPGIVCAVLSLSGCDICGGCSKDVGEVSTPWSSLTAGEITQAVRAVRAKYGADVLFSQISLAPADKDVALAWQEQVAPRRSAAVVFIAGGTPYEGRIALGSGRLSVAEITSGQPMLTVERDLIPAITAVLESPLTAELLAARGIEPDEAFCAPRTVGRFIRRSVRGRERRLVQLDCFYIADIRRNVYARPIEGIVVLYNLTDGKIVYAKDLIGPERAPPLSADTGDFHAGAIEARAELNAIEMRQPGGPNYRLHGSRIDWQNWRFHLRFDPRQGTVLNRLQFAQGGQFRSIAYEVAMAEMFVPYQDPTEAWRYRNYFDMGEYGFGNSSTRLQGADCPHYALLIDVVLHTASGEAYEADDRICVFEHNPQLPAWRHHEPVLDEIPLLNPHEARPAMELVVRMAATIGNYDYFQDFIFQQDGRMRIRLSSTGLDAVKGVRAQSADDPTAAEDTRWGNLIAPGRAGINHDHFFSYRLDLDVDGRRNSFQRHRLVPVDVSGISDRTSIWALERETPRTEKQARTLIDPARPAILLFANPERTNYLGYPTAYQIIPGSPARPLVHRDDPANARAGFTRYQLWVTPYDPKQQHPSGRHINQSPPAGLPVWVQKNRPLANKDLVAWATLGFHHAPIAEDWPVLPTKSDQLTLKPRHFFNRNPAIDLPE